MPRTTFRDVIEALFDADGSLLIEDLAYELGYSDESGLAAVKSLITRQMEPEGLVTARREPDGVRVYVTDRGRDLLDEGLPEPPYATE